MDTDMDPFAEIVLGSEMVGSLIERLQALKEHIDQSIYVYNASIH